MGREHENWVKEVDHSTSDADLADSDVARRDATEQASTAMKTDDDVDAAAAVQTILKKGLLRTEDGILPLRVFEELVFETEKLDLDRDMTLVQKQNDSANDDVSILWHASLVFCRHCFLNYTTELQLAIQNQRAKCTQGTALSSGELVKNANRDAKGLFYGKSVLELGSGLGHTGYCLVTHGGAKRLVMTEVPKFLPDLRSTVRSFRDDEAQKKIDIRELWWGDEGYDNFRAEPGYESEDADFDVIVGNDLVYDTSVHSLLMQTLKKFAIPNRTEILFSFVNRDFSWDFFRLVSEDRDVKWQVDSVPKFDELGLDDVHLVQLKIVDENLEE